MTTPDIDDLMRQAMWIPSAPSVSIAVYVPGGPAFGRQVSLIPRAYTLDEFCDFLAVQSAKMRQRLEDYYNA